MRFKNSLAPKVAEQDKRRIRVYCRYTLRPITTPRLVLLAPPPNYPSCPVPRITRAPHIIHHRLETLQSWQFLKDIRDRALLLARDAVPPHKQQAQVLEVPAFGSVLVAQAEEEPSQIDAALVLRRFIHNRGDEPRVTLQPRWSSGRYDAKWNPYN
ncbi:hypothetical protein PC9H_009082 [Pleurotus ostreatus]|uniref:Uncharacterized protein n=1 Tax=Pleurotus ostreatus TaxID=5322 RepID=A0A8H6ZQ18_PLEOS|nr:uncharacterized protein PC9H_009082 [Pleurotus ostreatus]KAF7426713.1 hypothetical protein PC9H_009082 [Pleurotus ostreatus]